MASTENDIGDTGATSLSDALKSNKTLAKLNLSGEHKRDNTQMAFINKQVFIVIISTENIIGDTGATSMSDALKSNATLTKLHLEGDHKAITHKWHPPTIQSFILIKITGNFIEETGATSLSDALKANTTLVKLELDSEDKRNNTQMAFTNNQLLFLSQQINRKQHWIHRSNIIE